MDSSSTEMDLSLNAATPRPSPEIFSPVISKLQALRHLGAVVPPSIRLIFLAWSMYCAYVFLHAGALVPDEINFLNIARATSYADLVRKAPPFNYGSAYWITLKLLHYAFAARALMLIMFLTVPLLLLRTIASDRMKVCAFLLWMTFPMAWWTGKLIGTEIPVLFLVTVALWCFHQRRFAFMAAVLGIALGFKITAAPAVMFFLFLLIATGPRMPGWPRRLLRNSAIFFAAVSISCPPILEIAQQLLKQSVAAPGANLFELFQRIMVVDRWERDAVFSGGVLRFSLMPIPLLLTVICATLVNWRAVVAVLLTAAVFMKMSIGSMTYYGWYWIALFPLFVYAVSRERNRTTPLWLLLMFGAAITINFFQQMPLVFDQTYQKSEQIRVLNALPAIQPCLIEALSKIKPRTIFNQIDHGFPLAYPAQISDFPSPEADAADVRLVGARILVSRRSSTGAREPSYVLYTSCDSVLVFVKQ